MSWALHLLAAAEPSKTPFYVAGAVLAAWAVVLSAIGLRRESFPTSRGGTTGVVALTGLLMAATLAAGIATASKPHKEAGREGVSTGPGEAQTPAEGQQGGTPGGKPARPSETGQASRKLVVSADPGGQLRYQQSALTARAGSVTIDFTNRSPVQHDVTIERDGRKVGGTKAIMSSTTSATVKLDPGSYTFYCSVDAHRQAGMQGKLTVQG